MATQEAIKNEIEHWFFKKYFHDFIAIGSGKIDPDAILAYWGVPLHMSGPAFSKWIASPDDVVQFLKAMQKTLKEAGYSHTEVIDKKIIAYNDNAGRVETIMSRCRDDGKEIDRAAISFEVRRAQEKLIIISTSTHPTAERTLQKIW